MGICGPLVYFIGFSSVLDGSSSTVDMVQIVQVSADLSTSSASSASSGSIDASPAASSNDTRAAAPIAESLDAGSPDSASKANSYAGYMPDSGSGKHPRVRPPRHITKNVRPRSKPRVKQRPHSQPRPGVKRGSGTVALTSPQSLVAYFKGRRLGQAPATFSLPTGRHRITLRNKKLGIKVTRQVVVRANKRSALTVELKQGKLVVKVRPWAHVEINGVRKGTTPIKPLSLYEGVYKLKLINTNVNYSYSANVTIRPGQVTKVVHRF